MRGIPRLEAALHQITPDRLRRRITVLLLSLKMFAPRLIDEYVEWIGKADEHGIIDLDNANGRREVQCVQLTSSQDLGPLSAFKKWGA